MKYFLLLIVFYCTQISESFAQQAIKGTVVDRNSKPVVDALVTIFVDSNAIATTVTDSSGRFLIESKNESATVEIAALGFEQITQIVTSSTANIITLQSAVSGIEEITINNRKPLFERKIDRTIYNVSQRPQASGSNALELIRKIPGVMVNSQSNTIGLVGKSGVAILVNDRIVQLSGEDLLNYLQAIPSENIERIEVITTPPARYDAAGNSGLINIVLKRNNKSGFNGSVRAGYELASYGRTRAGANANYRSGRLNIYASIDGGSGANQVTESLRTPYPQQRFDVEDRYRKQLKPLQATLGLDYNLSKRSAVGMEWNHTTFNRRDKAISDIHVLQFPALTLDSTMRTNSVSNTNNSSNTLNLNYSYNLDSSGRKLTVNINRLWYDGNRSNDFTTTNYLGIFEIPTGAYVRNSATGQQQINITTAQIDVDVPWRSKIALSAGAKMSAIDNESDNVFGGYTDDIFREDSAISNAFAYRERVGAAYINAQYQIRKWSFQAGLRGEYTSTKGYNRNLDQTNINQYFNLFPTAYIQYLPNEQNSFNLNYSKRINRPGYRALDPFRAYATPYHYNEGNPFLRPSFNHNFELAYTYKSRYTFAAFYQYERNHSGSVWQIDEASNTTSGLMANFADMFNYGINAFANIQLLSFWEVQPVIALQVQGMQSDLYGATNASYVLPMAYLSVNNNFTMNKSGTLFAELNVWYLSKNRNDFLETNAIASLDAGLKLLLLDKKMTIAVNGADLLATQKFKGRHIVTGQTINNYFDARNVRVSIAYKFGRNDIKPKAERTKGIEEEKGRGA